VNRHILATSVLAFVVLSGASAAAGQWPRFRGPDGAGVSDAKTIPVKWTDKDYNWKVKLPGVGHSSPVVWGRRIYLICGEGRTGKRTVLCLDTAGGKTLWRRDYASKPFGMHRDNSYASASPAADAEGVVVTWSTPDRVDLIALDADGKDLWRRDLGPYVGIHGSGSSPIIIGDVVVLANEQEDPKALPSVYLGKKALMPAGKSFLIGLDRKTGKTRWQIKRRSSQAAYSTPCVYRGPGGRVELIFPSTSHGITSVDPATGKTNWEMPGVFDQRCVGSPVAGAGLVFAGDGWGVRGLHYVAVRPGSQAKGVKPSVAYRLTRPTPLVPTPLVKGNRLFLWGDFGNITCLDVAGGKVIWRNRIRALFYGSPVWVGGRLYCIGRKGNVFVVAASDEFKLLGRIPLGEPSFATPAVSGGVMYLRTRSQLFSLGGKNGPR